MKTDLQPTNNVTEQIQEILSDRVNSCRLALQHADPHVGIHDARKQLKKIRAIIRLIRDDIPEKEYNRANTYFRDIGRMLSDARDTSALLEVTMALQASMESASLKASLEQVVHHLTAKKSAVTRYQFNQDHLLERAQEAFAPAENYIQHLKTTHQGFEALSASIERVYRRGKLVMEESVSHPKPENYHQWRKRVKYLRYQVDALSPIWPAMMNTLEDELHELTNALGADHDLYLLHQTILTGNLNEQNDWMPLFHLFATQRKRYETKAMNLGHKLYFWEPSQFSRWLQASWKASQSGTISRGESLIAI